MDDRTRQIIEDIAWDLENYGDVCICGCDILDALDETGESDELFPYVVNRLRQRGVVVEL